VLPQKLGRPCRHRRCPGPPRARVQAGDRLPGHRQQIAIDVEKRLCVRRHADEVVFIEADNGGVEQRFVVERLRRVADAPGEVTRLEVREAPRTLGIGDVVVQILFHGRDDVRVVDRAGPHLVAVRPEKEVLRKEPIHRLSQNGRVKEVLRERLARVEP
jgi:hypothetical protein